MTADLSALIARLEAAEVGSRELNGLIFRALADDPRGKDHWFVSCGELMTEDNAAPVTTSLDAALALAERVLGEDQALEILADEARAAHEDTINGCLKRVPIDVCINAILRAKQGEV